MLSCRIIKAVFYIGLKIISMRYDDVLNRARVARYKELTG
jgi:hypothetical protein